MRRDRQATLVIAAEPSSVGASRRFLRSALGAWNAGRFEEPATLLVSEMVTNVVVHARTPGAVVVALRERLLRVEVHDHCPVAPMIEDRGPGATTGRGMALIDRLSDDWGVERTVSGKLVWFELAVGGPIGLCAAMT